MNRTLTEDDVTFEQALKSGIVHTPEWLQLSEGHNFKPPEPLHPEITTNEEADKEIGRCWVSFAKQAYLLRLQHYPEELPEGVR